MSDRKAADRKRCSRCENAVIEVRDLERLGVESATCHYCGSLLAPEKPIRVSDHDGTPEER